MSAWRTKLEALAAAVTFAERGLWEDADGMAREANRERAKSVPRTKIVQRARPAQYRA